MAKSTNSIAQLDEMNRMDERPFMTLDLANVDNRVFPHLEMCTKQQFDSDTINASAEELKYVAEIKKVLASQFREPDAEWVKTVASRVTTRRLTANVMETFTHLVTTAGSQFLRDEANRRLRSAQDLEEPRKPLEDSLPEESAPADSEEIEIPDDGIITTEEELHAFGIIRAICCADVPATDITIRDAKSYCGILYQDNNRKPIARLFFDRKIPRIVIFDENREEQVFDMESVEDIYTYSDHLRARVRSLQMS